MPSSLRRNYFADRAGSGRAATPAARTAAEMPPDKLFPWAASHGWMIAICVYFALDTASDQIGQLVRGFMK